MGFVSYSVIKTGIMKKNILSIAIIAIMSLVVTNQLSAQIRFGFGGGYYGGRYYNRPYPQRHKNNNDNNNNQKKEEAPKFIPTVDISVGFGYPNVDKYLLPDLSAQGYVKGNYQKTGTYTAAIDYQFNRFTSLGLLGSYGTSSVPYFTTNAGPADQPVYNGTLTGWSVMANLKTYFAPVDLVKLNGYFRFAGGINVWDQKITDANGLKLNNISDPSEFAYQVSLGADFNLSPRAAFYVEAGYGKYILGGGLKFRF